MRSPRGSAGALVLLLGVPAAFSAAALGGNAETVFHFVLGASFLLFAVAAFNFRLPRWFSVAACAAIGVLAAIFLLQGVSDLAQSQTLRTIAYDVLGQRIEKLLGYAFLLWCVGVVAMDSGGWTRVLGAAAVATILCVEIYGFVAMANGGEEPGALKLLYLPLFAWLLLECLKPARVAER